MRTTSSVRLIGGGSPRHINTFSNLYIYIILKKKKLVLFTVAIHYTHINAGSALFTIPCCPLQNNQHTISCCYCWLLSYSFLWGLGNIAQENTPADILVEDPLRRPLDMETVDQERELHKPNSSTKREAFVVIQIVKQRCGWTILTTFPSGFFFKGGMGEFHKIKKQSSRRSLLENLESSGAKIMMRGPMYYTPVMRGKIQCSKHHEDEFWEFFFNTAGTLLQRRIEDILGVILDLCNSGWNHHLGN